LKVKVLGCSAAELPDANLSSFLVDTKLLLDAGTIGEVLDESEQWKIRNVLITHSHLDHIKDLPFLADNISINNRLHGVNVISTAPVNRALKKNIFNGIIWPDFTKIPNAKKPIITLKNISTKKMFIVDGYKITAYEVNHTVPSIGYMIEDKKGKRLLYIGDTGPSDMIWKALMKKVHGLIIEVSLPNRFKRMALDAGHLTPDLLACELEKIKILPEKIFITHCKPRYRDKIKKELKMLNIHNIRILRDGALLEI
jgi:ribonuclease BN (tRNA processing enzyme)